MACSSCGGKGAAGKTYPSEMVLPDGSRVTVTSAADERTQRDQYYVRSRREAASKGYSARRAR